MEDWEYGYVRMPERLLELAELEQAFQAQKQKPSLQWITECMTAISLSLSEVDDLAEKIELVATLTMAMWQAGYEAAPKLEFVLPEGGVG